MASVRTGTRGGPTWARVAALCRRPTRRMPGPGRGRAARPLTADGLRRRLIRKARPMPGRDALLAGSGNISRAAATGGAVICEAADEHTPACSLSDFFLETCKYGLHLVCQRATRTGHLLPPSKGGKWTGRSHQVILSYKTPRGGIPGGHRLPAVKLGICVRLDFSTRVHLYENAPGVFHRIVVHFPLSGG